MEKREALLNAKVRDLAAREQTRTTTLHGKDIEIEALLKQQTQGLEDSHKKSIETQALENAAKLKEVANEAAAVTTAKEDLEIQVGKLKEDLVDSGKEIEALKGEAQKATLALGELQSQILAKDQELNDAAIIAEDVKSKLAGLESNLESTKEWDKLSAEKLAASETLQKNTEANLHSCMRCIPSGR
ncbi:hypothetical protein VPH35_073000 [Triticum aestivum]